MTRRTGGRPSRRPRRWSPAGPISRASWAARSGVADVAGNRLVADVTWTFTTTPPDNTPPTVTGFTPANAATGQPLNTAPTATFSEAINAATLTTTTFSLTDQTTLAAVAGSVGYDTTNRRATFTPSAALVAGRTYLARVLGGASGVADVAGNRLAADVTWTFTTATEHGHHELPERPRLHGHGQRLGPGREGQEQRRAGRRRRQADHPQRHGLRQGHRGARRLGHPLHDEQLHLVHRLGRGRRRDRHQRAARSSSRSTSTASSPTTRGR